MADWRGRTRLDRQGTIEGKRALGGQGQSWHVVDARQRPMLGNRSAPWIAGVCNHTAERIDKARRA